jgi:hypothetical protein
VISVGVLGGATIANQVVGDQPVGRFGGNRKSGFTIYVLGTGRQSLRIGLESKRLKRFDRIRKPFRFLRFANFRRTDESEGWGLGLADFCFWFLLLGGVPIAFSPRYFAQPNRIVRLHLTHGTRRSTVFYFKRRATCGDRRDPGRRPHATPGPTVNSFISRQWRESARLSRHRSGHTDILTDGGSI